MFEVVTATVADVIERALDNSVVRLEVERCGQLTTTIAIFTPTTQVRHMVQLKYNVNH